MNFSIAHYGELAKARLAQVGGTLQTNGNLDQATLSQTDAAKMIYGGNVNLSRGRQKYLLEHALGVKNNKPVKLSAMAAWYQRADNTPVEEATFGAKLNDGIVAVNEEDRLIGQVYRNYVLESLAQQYPATTVDQVKHLLDTGRFSTAARNVTRAPQNQFGKEELARRMAVMLIDTVNEKLPADKRKPVRDLLLQELLTTGLLPDVDYNPKTKVLSLSGAGHIGKLQSDPSTIPPTPPLANRGPVENHYLTWVRKQFDLSDSTIKPLRNPSITYQGNYKTRPADSYPKTGSTPPIWSQLLKGYEDTLNSAEGKALLNNLYQAFKQPEQLKNPEQFKKLVLPLVQKLSQAAGIAGLVSVQVEPRDKKDEQYLARALNGNTIMLYNESIVSQLTDLSTDPPKEMLKRTVAAVAHELGHVLQFQAVEKLRQGTLKIDPASRHMVEQWRANFDTSVETRSVNDLLKGNDTDYRRSPVEAPAIDVTLLINDLIEKMAF